MQTIEDLLAELKKQAKKRGLYFKRPMGKARVQELVLTLKGQLGLELPDEYVRLLKVTDGIQTQGGYLADLQDIIEQNIDRWLMDVSLGQSDDGSAEITFTPLPPEARKTPSHIWLGYEGNMEQFIYDLVSGEYLDTPIGDLKHIRFRSTTLVEFLRHMVR